jgi:hypothetical protein
LTEPRDVCGVGLALGPFIGEFPRALGVAVSRDGENWMPAWNGMTAGLAVEAALRDPVRVDVRIDMPRQPSMRFVSLEQQGRDAEHAWGIAELQILGCQ